MTQNPKKILSFIQKHYGTVEMDSFVITIVISRDKITENGIFLLNYLLNNYSDYYFITISNLPPCFFPEAKDYIINKRDKHGEISYRTLCYTCARREDCGGLHGIKESIITTLKPIKNIPHEVVMEITTECNLNCVTCTINKTRSANLTFSTAKKIMDECKKLGIKAIRFTGGEPFKNKDAEKMFFYAKENRFYVLVNTNATLLNSAILDVLKNTTDNILVSLQGFNEKNDNRLTRSGADFRVKLNNIVQLKKKVPVLRIGTIISRTLMENINTYYALLKKMGINTWELYRPITKSTNEEFNISKKDILKVMEKLLSFKKRGMKVKIANPVPFCITEKKILSLSTLLGAKADDGHSRIIFDVQGYFKPSYFINENLGGSIKNAWESTFLKKIRSLEYLPPQCRKCTYLQWCRGGSRALAKIAYNDYFTIDPLAK